MPLEEAEKADDAKLMIYHMNHLSADVRRRFVSDMGFVVDYLNEGNFENRRDQEIIHLEALCDMMEALTEDIRFTEQAKKILDREEKGGNVMMCEYINMLEARGEIKGEIKGEARLTFLLTKLYDQGRDEEAKLAVRDMDVREGLYRELGIENSHF